MSTNRTRDAQSEQLIHSEPEVTGSTTTFRFAASETNLHCYALCFHANADRVDYYKDNKLKWTMLSSVLQSVEAKIEMHKTYVPRVTCWYVPCVWQTIEYRAGYLIMVLNDGLKTRRKKLNDVACIEDELAWLEVRMLEINRLIHQHRYLPVAPNHHVRSTHRHHDDDHVIDAYVLEEQKSPEPHVELVDRDGDNDHAIAVGTCCYVDCQEVKGVVTGHLSNSCYMIFDLFELKERRTSPSSLTEIPDDIVVEEVRSQYQQYLTKM